MDVLGKGAMPMPPLGLGLRGRAISSGGSVPGGIRYLGKHAHLNARSPGIGRWDDEARQMDNLLGEATDFLTCPICHCKTTDESPIHADHDAEWEGRMPWIGGVPGAPEGRIDKICANVYRVAFKVEYKTLQIWLTKILESASVCEDRVYSCVCYAWAAL
jgi:hypothetical protein